MRLALKNHGLRWLLPANLAIAAMAAVIGGIRLPVPSLGGTNGVPVAVLAALAGCILLSLATNTAWPASRTVPVRSPALVLTGVLAAVLLPTLLVVLIVALLAADTTGFVYLGVWGWLLALQLLTGTWLSMRHQAVGPVAYVLLCALLGRVDSSVQPWAWPLASVSAPVALAVGGAALAIAVASLLAHGMHDPLG